MAEFRPLPLNLPQEPGDAPPTFGNVLGASLRQEAPAVAAYNWFTAERPQADPTFEPGRYLEDRPELIPRQRHFVNAESEAEADQIAARLRQEEQDREIRSAAGWVGFATDMAASLLGPSSFMPIAAGAKGLNALRVAGSVAGATSVDEAILQSTQLTRTLEESALNVGGSALLGVVLGGAASALSRQEFGEAVQALRYNEPVRTGPNGSTMGAVDLGGRLDDPGPLAGTLTEAERLTGRREDGSPVTLGARALDRAMRAGGKASTIARGVMQEDSPTLRAFVARISTAGLTFRKNLDGTPTVLGSTVENAVWRDYGTFVPKVLDATETSFAKYRLGKSEISYHDRVRTEVTGIRPAAGKMSRSQFNEAVFFEVQNPTPNALPEVKEAAERVRQEFFEPLFERAKAAGLFPDSMELDDVVGAKHYLTHIYDKAEIERNPNDFVDMLTESFERQLNNAYLKRQQKLTATKGQAEQDITDLSQPRDQMIATLKDIKAQRESLAESEAIDTRDALREVRAELRDLQRMSRTATNEQGRFVARDRVKELQDEEKRLEDILAEDAAQAVLEEDKFLRRRQTMLNQSVAALTDKQARTLQRIDKLEEQSVNQLRRLAAKTDKFMRDMRRWSDAEVEKGIAKLESNFAATLARLERTEERIAKLVDENPDLVGPQEFSRRIQRFRREVFQEGLEGERPPEEYLNLRDEASRRDALARLDMVIKQGFLPRAFVQGSPDASRKFIDGLRQAYEGETPKGIEEWLEPEEVAFGQALGFDTPAAFAKFLHEGGDLADERLLTGAQALPDQSGVPEGVKVLVDELTPQQLRSLTSLRREIAEAKIVDPSAIEKRLQQIDRLDAQTEGYKVKLNVLSQRLDELSDPREVREALEEFYRDTLTEVNGKLTQRSARREKLWERASRQDPELARRKIEEIQGRVAQREASLRDWLLDRPKVRGEEVQRAQVDGDTVDFSDYAKAEARSLKEKILGDPQRVAGLDLVAERGPELARGLDIPLDRKARFLERDVDKVARIYGRQIIPDIELKRAFGDVNAAKAYDDIMRDFQERIAEVEELTPETARERGWRGKDFEKHKQDLAQDLRKRQERAGRLVTGLIQRLRHQRAIPDDPESYFYRGGRLLQQWNTLTMMGNVVIPSQVDPAVAVWKYGFKRVFRHGVKPLIGDVKNLKLSAREAQYAGLNELMLQDRYHLMNDIVEDAGRMSRGEKAVDFITSKIGIVGLFSYWTQYMKQWVAPIAAGRLLDSVEAVVTGSTKNISQREARQVLASLGFDSGMAERIWRQRDVGGLVNNNGLWVPHTEKWTDVEAQEAFRAALVGEINATIVTPGVERPLFTDATLGLKLLTQFQSFMWSSHTKVLLAGLQTNQWRMVEGVLAMIPLGAWSYYADMVARGRREEAEEAGLDKWADEIITRSPFLGVFAQAKRIGDATPGVAPYINFSSEGAERRYASSLISATLGPSVSTAEHLGGIGTGIDDPTQATANHIRRLTPFNNVTHLRLLFDKIVENSGLPEERD